MKNVSLVGTIFLNPDITFEPFRHLTTSQSNYFNEIIPV